MKSLIYVGMDVHKESYSLCAYLPNEGEFIGETKIDAKASLIKEYLDTIKKILIEERDFEEVEFITGYEAGCLGFSLYKELTKYGINCKIIAPTTLTKTVDSSLKKSDRKDARMLARNLFYGTCSYVHIPDDVDLETKEYIRMRTSHKRALKKLKQQILSFCLRCGYKYDGKAYWTARHISYLKNLELKDLLKETMDEYIDSYEKSVEKLNRLEGKIEERSNLERYKENTDKLACLKGITKAGALTIISEVSDFNRFGTPNEFCSYLGLVPAEHSSGETNPNLGITKLGNIVIRTQLIESAQSIVIGAIGTKSKRIIARQKDQSVRVISYCDRAIERLMRKYHRLLNRGVPRNKCITAVARELACFIWGLMNNKLDERVIGGQIKANS